MINDRLFPREVKTTSRENSRESKNAVRRETAASSNIWEMIRIYRFVENTLRVMLDCLRRLYEFL